MILGSEVRAALGVDWPLIPAVDDGTQKRTIRPWKHLQHVSAGEPYDHLRSEMWSVCTGAGTGVVVLDFDGAAGEAKRQEWGLDDPHVRTGSGGHHVYVAHPGWAVLTYSGSVRQGVPGVDVRGDRGVAHVAGSSRKGPYTVLRPLSDLLAFSSLCPAARAATLRRRKEAPDTRPAGWIPGPAYRAGLIEWKVADLLAGGGMRNQALNNAAYGLAQQRVPFDEAYPPLMAAAERIGLTEQESRWTICSGYGIKP